MNLTIWTCKECGHQAIDNEFEVDECDECGSNDISCYDIDSNELDESDYDLEC